MSNVIDYFAVLGSNLKAGAMAPHPLQAFVNSETGQPETKSASELWANAITDVGVMFNGEELPNEQGWEVLDRNLDGDMLQRPHIIFRRRMHSNRADHIIDIKLVLPEDTVPLGYEIVADSIGRKYPGYLKPLGYLVVNRADISSHSYSMYGYPMIYDMCISTDESQEVPEEYTEIKRVDWMRLNEADLFKAVKIGYLPVPAVGVCNLTFEHATVDRFPKQDRAGSSLLVNELPMFAFPYGLQLKYDSASQFPLPSFFTMVFTDIKGDHLYAACLRFHEAMPSSGVTPILQHIFGPQTQLTVPSGHHVYAPKVICVITRKPYYRAMRRLLRQIYSMSLSSLRCPIENFISMIVTQLPHPIAGGRPYHVILDAAQISATSRGLAPIIFDQPVARFFPHMDLDFAGALRCLSVENLLVVFTLLLREAKVVFLCTSNNLLTEVMETLRSLLFPLNWSSTFISRMPDVMIGVLEAPGGFMIGCHVPPSLPPSETISSRTPSGAPSSSWQQSITAGTYVVDLSTNTISQYDGNSMEKLAPAKLRNVTKILPPGPKKRLESKLTKIAAEYKIGPQITDFEKFDSAFDVLFFDEHGVDEKKWAKFPTLEVRDIFMAFMIDLIGNYTRYIIPVSKDLKADTFRTFKESFRVREYLADADPSAHTVLELLTETQMFSVLLQQRAEGDAYSQVFFDKASALLRDLGLSLGGHGGKFFSVTSAIDLPAPVYKLLAADERWSLMNGRSTDSSTVVILDKHGNHVGTIPNNKMLAQSPPPTQSPQSIQSQFQLQSQALSSTASKASALASSVASSFFRSSPHAGSNAGTALNANAAAVAGDNSNTNSPLTMAAGANSPHSNSNSRQQQADYSKIQKDYLKTLLAYIQHFEGSGNRVEMEYVNDTDGVTAHIPRDELDKEADLHLHDITYGPLIIPGPRIIRQEPATGPTESDADEVMFDYKHGWPALKDTYLNLPRECLNSRWIGIRETRGFALDKIDHRLSKCIRLPNERLSFYFTGRLQRPVQISAPEESQAAVAALIDIASISVLMLTARSIRNPVQPTSDVLQSLGILAQLDHLSLLPHVDENVWRSVLVACEATGGDLMRRIANVVYDSLGLYNITPNSLTYGQYMLALSATKYKHKHGLSSELIALSSNSNGGSINNAQNVEDSLRDWNYVNNHLDSYFFLDEAGLSWYTEKEHVLAVQEAGQSPTPTHTTSPSRVSSTAATSRTGSSVVVKKTLSFRKLSQHFSLVKSAGIITFLRPFNFYHTAAPISIQEISLRDDRGRLVPFSNDTVAALNDRFREVHSAASPVEWAESISPDNARLRLFRYVSSGDILKYYQIKLTFPVVSATDTPLRSTGTVNEGMRKPNASLSSSLQDVGRQKESNQAPFASAELDQHTVAAPAGAGVGSRLLRLGGNLTWSSGYSSNTGQTQEGSNSSPVKTATQSNGSKDSMQSDVDSPLTPPRNGSGTTGGSLDPPNNNPNRWSSMFDPRSYLKSNPGNLKGIPPSAVDGIGLHTKSTPQSPSGTELAEFTGSRRTFSEVVDGDDDDDDETDEGSSVGESDDGTRRGGSDILGRDRDRADIVSSLAKQMDAEKEVALTAASMEGSLDFITENNLESGSTETDIVEPIVAVSAHDRTVESGEPTPITASASVPVVASNMTIGIGLGSNSSNSIYDFANAAAGLLVPAVTDMVSALTVSRGTTTPITPSDATAGASMTEAQNSPNDEAQNIDGGEHLVPDIVTAANVDGGGNFDVNDLLKVASPTEAETLALHEDDIVSRRRRNSERRMSRTSITSTSATAIVAQALEDQPMVPQIAGAPVTEGEQSFGNDADRIEQLRELDSAVVAHASTLTSSSATSASTESLHIQNDISKIYRESLNHRRQAIGIHSQTVCSCCGHAMLDEEMLAVWSGCSASGGAHKPLISKLRSITAMHQIKCPSCKSQILTPELHIRCYEYDEGANRHGNAPTPETPQSHLALLWTEDVPHISPFGLRLALEDMVECIGERISDSRWLHHHCPEIYWSILWYSARASMPCGFLPEHLSATGAQVAAESPYFSNQHGTMVNFHGTLGQRSVEELNLNLAGHVWHGPVVIGWREHVVNAKVAKLLSGLDPSSSLGLLDVFPGLVGTGVPRRSAEVVVPALNDIVENLNGSLAGMRIAMISMHALLTTGDVGEGAACGSSISRKLYISLLSLAHLCKHSQMTAPLVSDVPNGLNKGIAFDRILLDALRCVMSRADYEKFGCTEKDLMDAMPDEAAKAMRLGLGILL